MKSFLLRRFVTFSVVLCNKRFQNTSALTALKMKVFIQKRNPITGSTDWDMQDEDYDYHQEIARSAFADMLHDTDRNKKYHRALQIAIEKLHEEGKKANVLDIGTGTGLLSIMAAQCGADSIVACEAFKPMADCCIKILKSNNVANKITVIPKRSTDLTVGEGGDMKAKANILVTEVFDTELIGEGALSTFSHAHKYLLEEDPVVIPDSAIMYAQVIECPLLQKWNKLNDLADEELEIILRTPPKMKECPGSAAVHDIQLSQLPKQSFRVLSEHLPVFYYDWSGKLPIDTKRSMRQEYTVPTTGKAQMVFMWWELNMDPEGLIVLSCAPWWAHPDSNKSCERPQDTIPWRDHWMQAVYYLPQEVSLHKGNVATLISCQDEYSLWFYLEKQVKHDCYKRPICECGVHMALSRTQVSYLNDGRRSKKLLSQLRQEMGNNATVLDLNGSSLMGLAAAKMGAKLVYVLENLHLNIGILNDYIQYNRIDNVTLIPDFNDELLAEVTTVVCDPNFSSAILPWDNLKMAYLLYKCRDQLNEGITIIPEGCEFWAMPVEFLDLHKIRVPIGKCEGIDMSIFDELVENSRMISDAEIEAQPLWEYPCRCRGSPRRLLEIDMHDLRPIYAADGENNFVDTESEETHPINGFALWAEWIVDGRRMSTGPMQPPEFGGIIDWDMHTRQAVKILKTTRQVNATNKWSFQVACDLDKGQFNVDLDVVEEE